MTFTGFAIWTIVCAVLAGGCGLAGATLMSLRRSKPKPELWWRWFRMYACVGLVVWLLNFVVRYALWLGRQYGAMEYGHMAVSFGIIIALAGIFVVARSSFARARAERAAAAEVDEVVEMPLSERLVAAGFALAACPRDQSHRMAIPPSRGLWCPACADAGFDVWCETGVPRAITS